MDSRIKWGWIGSSSAATPGMVPGIERGGIEMDVFFAGGKITPRERDTSTNSHALMYNFVLCFSAPSFYPPVLHFITPA